jgi:hypothetical protein
MCIGSMLGDFGVIPKGGIHFYCAFFAGGRELIFLGGGTLPPHPIHIYEQ